jgi:hypothetical protein
MRKKLEKEAVRQYTVIPSLAHLGFGIVVFTFARSKELVQPLWEKGKKWASEHRNVVYLTTG